MRDIHAGVAELAYAGHSKCPGRKALWVRVPPPAPGVLALLALIALLAPLWLASPAEAQRRDFVGRVVSIDAKSLAVKDRRANIVTFARAEQTVVEGKSGWDAIATGDKVLVRWTLGNASARRVIVLESAAKPAH